MNKPEIFTIFNGNRPDMAFWDEALFHVFKEFMGVSSNNKKSRKIKGYPNFTVLGQVTDKIWGTLNLQEYL
ncbi:hypothetical protein FGF1_18420 [Flavobacteriaceae bacterium GF1]